MWMKIYECVVLCSCLLAAGAVQAPGEMYDVTIEDIELPTPISEEDLLDSAEVRCLQKNIYFEARNQGIEGMRAVAAVTLNRVEDSRFPDTVCGVVYQRRQFSWANNGDRQPDLRNKIERQAWNKSHELAVKALVGTMMEHGVQSAQYFHTININPSWNRNFEEVATIGDHVFYYQPQ